MKRFTYVLCVTAVMVWIAVTWHQVRSVSAQSLVQSQQASRYQELSAKPLHTLTNVDLAESLQLRQRLLPALQPAERMRHLAAQSLDQPYRRFSVQFDLADSDCVVFVNRMIAMSVANDWTSYYRVTERLRHKDGVVDYRNRNFLTLQDWVPNNAWLLRDMTAQLGPAGARVAQAFSVEFRTKRFRDIQMPDGVRTQFLGCDFTSIPAEVRQDFFIPRARVPEVLRQLTTGDVCLVIRRYDPSGKPTSYDCDHLGLIVRAPDDNVLFLHSAPPKVRQESLMGFLKEFPRVAGLKFLRVRDDASSVVAGELTRIGDTIPVRDASAEDQRCQQLRARRSGQ